MSDQSLAHPRPTNRLKWGWNVETDEAVYWAVSEVGDGRPTHAEFLEQEWGRDPHPEDGDVVGMARWLVLEDGENLNDLVVEAHYDSVVPNRVVELFSEAFPDATITTVP